MTPEQIEALNDAETWQREFDRAMRLLSDALEGAFSPVTGAPLNVRDCAQSAVDHWEMMP